MNKFEGDFLSNPVIRLLAQEPRWTYSNEKKVPINIRQRIDANRQYFAGNTQVPVPEYGARTQDRESLTTLFEINSSPFKDINNRAFYLRSETDGLVCLDIEKTCPPDLRDELLSLPHLYAETSLSGQGYHLLMRCPPSWDKFKNVHRHPKLQEKHGFYEFLHKHYMTFTGNQIHLTTTKTAQDYDALWVPLAEKVKVTAEQYEKFVIDANRQPELDDAYLTELLRVRYRKTPSDFDNDLSRWEYGYLSTIHQALQRLEFAYKNSRPALSEEEKCWLVFKAGEQLIPARDKHLGFRSGMPYLLYQASTLVAKAHTEHTSPTK